MCDWNSRYVPKVWIVTGWFGSDEWIESVHATENSASAACAELWTTRHSEHEPDYIKEYKPRGLSKFGYDEYELQGAGGESNALPSV